MLSNPLHRFSPYHSIPSNTLLSNGHMPSGHLHTTGLDTLAQGSHYALQQLQQHVSVHNPHLTRPESQQKHRQHPYAPAARTAGTSGPIRRRISRACDQCNQLRTKCDGQHPCAHCIEFGLSCEYIRERKKRGKASRKDLAQQAAAQAAAAAHTGRKSPAQSSESGGQMGEGRSDSATAKTNSTLKADSPSNPNGKMMSVSDMGDDSVFRSQRTGSLDSIGDMDAPPPQAAMGGHAGGMDRNQMESPSSLDLNGYGGVHAAYDRPSMNVNTHMMGGAAPTPYGSGQAGNMSSYPELPYLQTHSPTSYAAGASGSFPLAPSPLNAYPAMGAETASPGWMNMASPPGPYASQQQHMGAPSYAHAQLRYPVLEPLLPHLGGIMPVSLACDLIDLYFASSSSAQMHPMSPYVLGFVFRKRSFLHPAKPRQCQPALLASMLWVAAQTSDAPLLTSVPSARGKICQKLLELTVSLLKPLIHAPSGDGAASPVSSPIVDGVALGGLGVALPGSIGMEALTGEFGAFGAAGTLDDVATYIHLATVVSASEYKGASLRWWNSAWSLARELKLGRELPQNSPPDSRNDMDGSGVGGVDGADGLVGGSTCMVSEEEREERRRIWWLVYIVDRHLALCYNRPLFLLDRECSGLLQPMDDSDFQSGNFPPSSSSPNSAGMNNMLGPSSADLTGAADPRPRGPAFECRGHGIFGYFLPLMTILGEIVDLHQARNHPRFGVGFRASREWDLQMVEISRHLETYGESLAAFEQHHMALSAQAAEEKAAAEAAAGLSGAGLGGGSSSGRAGSVSAASDSIVAAVAAAAAAVTTPGGSVVQQQQHHQSQQPSQQQSQHQQQQQHSQSQQSQQQDGNGSSSNNGGSSTTGTVVVRSSSVAGSRMTESDIQTRIVLAYGHHVMHVLHILCHGKWDPLNLLDDNDLWISSEGFIAATQHAVDAAEAISHILEFDPGLEFMPFFFGIYLLQGSFLLLLIADKLQLEASASVVKACETIIRAHEACVVTLNTEYQRNFSKVMRSALAQVRGRVPEDLGEQHQRRRELLGLYRWTGDGTGLAL